MTKAASGPYGDNPLERIFHDACQRAGASGEDRLATVQALSATMGEASAACVAGYIDGDRDAVVSTSADFLTEWMRLMAASGVKPEDVYRELDHRMQFAALLRQFSEEDTQGLPARRGRRRLWRPSTTKLP